MGHGEWAQPDNRAGALEHGNPLLEEPDNKLQWLNEVDEDIRIHNQVLQQGYPNRWGAQITVKSRWNLELFARLLEDYEDKEIIQWLTYGWPTGSLPTLGEPSRSLKNHKGATDYPQDLEKYIKKEKQHQAVMGPYKNIPFKDEVGIAPLSTRPKKESQERSHTGPQFPYRKISQ